MIQKSASELCGHTSIRSTICHENSLKSTMFLNFRRRPFVSQITYLMRESPSIGNIDLVEMKPDPRQITDHLSFTVLNTNLKPHLFNGLGGKSYRQNHLSISLNLFPTCKIIARKTTPSHISRDWPKLLVMTLTIGKHRMIARTNGTKT